MGRGLCPPFLIPLVLYPTDTSGGVHLHPSVSAQRWTYRVELFIHYLVPLRRTLFLFWTRRLLSCLDYDNTFHNPTTVGYNV